jgi:hypothetical protein
MGFAVYIRTDTLKITHGLKTITEVTQMHRLHQTLEGKVNKNPCAILIVDKQNRLHFGNPLAQKSKKNILCGGPHPTPSTKKRKLTYADAIWGKTRNAGWQVKNSVQ